MTTFLLVPGAGGDGWFWHRVVPLLVERGHRAVAVTLPTYDETAGLAAYRDAIIEEGRDLGPVQLVAQSMGAFSATLAVEALRVDQLVLLNAMVPAPGESAGDWWQAVGQSGAARTAARADGRSEDFDPVRDFFHDVPDEVRAAVLGRGETRQAVRPFGEPWPLDRWPDVDTRGLAGADDRLFPAALQQRVARERIGVELDIVPGGHLLALSRPEAVAEFLVS